MNREHIKYAIIGIAIILSAYLLGRAYTYKYRSQDTVVVTGLGETEFESDLIVWSGVLTAEAAEAADGYRRIEQSKRKVSDYLAAKGIDAKQVVWNFVNVDKTYQTVYSANGNYAGQRFTGYSLRQEFSIESTDVDLVENVSREISALIAQGVSIEARQPDYYYTKLDDVKAVAHRTRFGRRTGACREDRAERRNGHRRRSLGAHGRLPDHGRQRQRGVLGRRIVQHREPSQEGPHHDAHRVSDQIVPP